MSTQTVFVTAGSTSKTIDVALVQKAAATSPGDPITGLAFNTSSLTAYYRNGATGTLTAITLATQTVGGAYSSGGFVEISSTNAPGLYRFDVPNAVIATAGIASVTFTGAANLATHTVYFVVTAVDFYDSVRGGMTALPNAAAAASGGLFTRGTGAGQINQDANGRIDVNQVAAGGAAGTYASGIPAVSLTSAANTAAANVVWDTACSAHVTAGSFGQALGSEASGTAQGGASTTITLAAGASAVNDFYKYQIIKITAGTGTGQGNIISGYVGSTKVATVTAWATAPDNTSVYAITPFGAVPGATAPTAAQNAAAVWDEARSSHTTAGTYGQSAQVVRTGTAQAGAAGSITLDSGASATNDLYKYDIVTIIGGTGAGQSRQITAYTGSSKVATVGINWTVAPDSTSVFMLLPLGVDAATIAAIAQAVWDEARASHTSAGTFGEYVLADAERIGGNATAAVNAKSAFDGATGFGFTNCTMPQVTTVTGNVNGSVGSVTGAVGSVTGAVGSVTGAVGSVTAGVTVSTNSDKTGYTVSTVSDKTGYSLSTTGIDALYTRALTESYNADGSPPTVAQALFLVMQMLTEMSISGTTMTIKKLDGTTTALTLTLNDSSAPTAVTRSG